MLMSMQDLMLNNGLAAQEMQTNPAEADVLASELSQPGLEFSVLLPSQLEQSEQHGLEQLEQESAPDSAESLLQLQSDQQAMLAGRQPVNVDETLLNQLLAQHRGSDPIDENLQQLTAQIPANGQSAQLTAAIAAEGANLQQLTVQLPANGQPAQLTAAIAAEGANAGMVSVNALPLANAVGSAKEAGLQLNAEVMQVKSQLVSNQSSIERGWQTVTQTIAQQPAVTPAVVSSIPTSPALSQSVSEMKLSALQSVNNTLSDSISSTTVQNGQAFISPAAMTDRVAEGRPNLSAPLTLNTQSAESVPQQLKAALGERLQLQVDNRVQHATIRLDPPDMGKIDISLQLDGGRLQVNIHASQSDVYRALQQMSQELRNSLTEQNYVQVNVNVSSQNDSQGGREQHFAAASTEEIQAAQQSEPKNKADRRNDDSILMTV